MLFDNFFILNCGRVWKREFLSVSCISTECQLAYKDLLYTNQLRNVIPHHTTTTSKRRRIWKRRGWPELERLEGLAPVSEWKKEKERKRRKNLPWTGKGSV